MKHVKNIFFRAAVMRLLGIPYEKQSKEEYSFLVLNLMKNLNELELDFSQLKWTKTNYFKLERGKSIINQSRLKERLGIDKTAAIHKASREEWLQLNLEVEHFINQFKKNN